jgi:hypothetical protein
VPVPLSRRPRRALLALLAIPALALAGCANDPPTASFTMSPNPAAGQTVTFDGSASTGGRDEVDQPISINRWEWDLDGNGTFERTTSGPTVRHTFEGRQTVEVGLRVVNMRNVASPAVTRTVVTTEYETATAPAGVDCDTGGYDSHACGSERLAAPAIGGQEEHVNGGPSPNWSLLPSFSAFFGGSFSTSSTQRVGVVVGGDRVFVLTYSGHVRKFEAGSLADEGSFFAIENARDIAFYRNEVFVLASDGDIAVFDRDGTPRRVLRMVHPAGLTALVDQASFQSLAVAWGEVWSTIGLGDKNGSGLLVRDSTSGAFKYATAHNARSQCYASFYELEGTEVRERCIEPTNPATDSPNDWAYQGAPGIAAVPEWWALVSQCRVYQRNLLLGLTYGIPSAANATELPWARTVCRDGGDRAQLMGAESVWGRGHFLQVMDHPSSLLEAGWSDPGTRIDEFQLFGQSNGSVELVRKRSWAPQDKLVGYRDIAYRTRDTKIDWSGVLTQNPTDWLRSPNNTEDKCLHYVVSDADIYVVGTRGERWYELSAGLNRVDLLVDGNSVKSSTLPEGDFCINTRSFGSGTHRLEVRAHLNNWTRTVSAVNERLRVDNTPPHGELVAPEVDVHGTMRFVGTIADDHAGTREWALEVQRIGETVWRRVCTGSLDAATGHQACSWNSADGLSPDGEYRIRARMVDAAGEGGNVGHSRVWEPVVVTNSGDWDEATSPGDTAENPRPGLPETFFETPAPETTPDDSGDAYQSRAVAFSCQPSDPFVVHVSPVYAPGPTGRLAGSTTPELEIQSFTSLPEAPHVPVTAFARYQQGSDWSVWVARENGAAVASVLLHKLPNNTWITEELSGCSAFLDRFAEPDPTSVETGVKPVDDAAVTVESNTAGIP